MKKRAINIPFITNDESKIVEIPDFFIIGDIIFGIQVQLPNEDSGTQQLKLYTKQIDFLPIDTTISFHSDPNIVYDTQRNARFSKYYQYVSISCLFNFNKIKFLESSNKPSTYSLEITFQIKTNINSKEKSNFQPDKSVNNQIINPTSIINLLHKNGQVSQNDIDTIMRDFQIINSPTKNSSANTGISQKRSDEPKASSINKEQNSQKQKILNDQKKEPIQLEPIKNQNITQKVQNQPMKRNQYNGLLNQGSTCYLNTVIQNLFHIPFFRNVIYQFKLSNDTNRQEKVIKSLQSLFYNLEYGNIPCNTRLLTSSLGMSNQDVMIQHDAQEFFIHFTDQLIDILKSDEKQKDKIEYIFGGKTIQTVKNSGFQILSSHEEKFFELIIGLAESVEISLRNFVKEEIINDYNDDRTQTVQKVTMQTKLLKLPRVLKLLIKRYQYDNGSSLNYKDNRRMEFSENLDLSPFVYNNGQNGCTKYKLYGVIVHQGTHNGGHYYTYIRPEMKGNWFLFNDSNVSSSTSHDAIENNFGGFSGYFSYVKSYSAYILIYVRVDSINEMFMLSQNESPRMIQIPSEIRLEAKNENNKELNRMKSDPLCQILFNIFNERCIIENCKNGIPSIFNNEYKINISVDLRMKSLDLYQKVSNQIKLNINCFRLWILSNDYQQLIRIIDPEEQISQLGSQNLFLEIKNENENLLFNENTRFYFLVLYTQLITNPFVFLKTGHYNIPSLKYETIIDDALQVINNIIQTNIQISDSKIFVINSTNISRKFVATLRCTDKNGTIIIIQIDNDNLFNPTDSLIDSLEEKIGIKKKLNFIQKNEIETNDSIYNYFDYMASEIPKTPDKYFDLKSKTRIVNVYNFNNINEIEGRIEIPLNIKKQDLVTFIQFVFNIDQFNEQNKSILLFSKEENLQVPSLRPISYISNIDTIYYCVVSNQISRNFSAKTRIVQLSKDGFQVNKTVCYYLPEADIHPFSQFVLLNEQLFRKGTKTRMFIVNENKEFGPPITDENGVSFDNKNILRIEKVSDDQISNELILVQKARVGKYYKIEAFGDPFYFAYIENEPTLSFKKRMNNFLGKDESYKVHKKRSYYNDSYVMNETVHIDKWEKQRVLYLVY